MINFVAPSPIYTFLKYCNSSSLEKKVLDCGAGGTTPPLAVFREYGYKTYGIEISNDQLKKSSDYCKDNNVDLNIQTGDMKNLMFNDEEFNFIYSYNTTVHMSKDDFKIAIKEIQRVLSKGGYLYVNFLTKDCSTFGVGEELNKGEYQVPDGEGTILFSHYEDFEVEGMFTNMEILHKEKRIVERNINGKNYKSGFLDYILIGK